MKKSRRTVFTLLFACVLVAGCKTLPGPKEVTPDGLTRVPSRGAGGVFREANWPFSQYQRLIVEPLTVSFIKDWEANHREVSKKEIQRIRDETAKTFREQFERELIKEGKYTFANDPAPDVLIVSPTVTELDIPAPENEDISMKTFAPKSVGLRVTGELRDAASGRLIGRVDLFGGGERYGTSELRPANRGTNAYEVRDVISDWIRLLREALNVAKTERQP